MKQMLLEIEKNRKGKVGKFVKTRLGEFSSFEDKDTKEWFSELCFCLLTANSKAKTALQIQSELKAKGFTEYPEKEIRDCIIKNKHRFHNNKAKYIVCARDHIDIKKKIQSLVAKEGQLGARQWLKKNIKGLGMKESSHFLRNVGYFNLSILDRHILKVMQDSKMISKIPKPLSEKQYVEIEKKFLDLAKKMKMSAAELDFHMWYLRTGEILK